jgi:hypothetical protein
MLCLVAMNWSPNWVFEIGNPNTTIWMCSVFVSGIGNQFRGHSRPQLTYPLSIQRSRPLYWRSIPEPFPASEPRSHSSPPRATLASLAVAQPAPPRRYALPPSLCPLPSLSLATIRRPWPPSSLPPFPLAAPSPRRNPNPSGANDGGRWLHGD